MNRAAFFDLDGTLLRVNSGKLWFRRERAAGRLSRSVAIEAGIWLGLYGLGLMRAQTALGRAAASLAGQSEELIVHRTRDFFEEDLKQLFFPGARAAVEAHREAGDRLVLLTSSSTYLAECVKSYLNLDDVLAMRFEVDGGQFTGGIHTLCYGSAKVDVAEAYAAREDIDLARSWFYSDSITDLPMLERVGRAMVVAPDIRLSRRAKKMGWPVLDWSTSNPSEVRESA